MKKIILGMIVLLLTSSYAHATADGPDCWDVTGVANNDVLNIREGAGVSYKIVGTIPPHAQGVANSNNLQCPDAPLSPKPNHDKRDKSLINQIDAKKHQFDSLDTKECGSGWCKVTYNKITGWVNCKYLAGSGNCGQ